MSDGSGMKVEVDFLWEEERVAVQIDGPGKPCRNQDEHLAEIALEALGYRVLHFTEREFEADPGRIMSAVAAAMGQQT